MKFLRAIRFDASDLAVYAAPAGEGEWAVSGAFEFTGHGDEGLAGKTRQAFVSGFLALPSGGRTTFASVASLGEDERRNIRQMLCRHLLDHCGAPDEVTAAAAADEELDFVGGLCAEARINTIFSVFRRLDENGNIREAFRDIAAPAAPRHARIWEVEDDHG